MLQVVLIAALVIILFPWVRRRLGRLLWYVVAALVAFLLIVMLTQDRAAAADGTRVFPVWPVEQPSADG